MFIALVAFIAVLSLLVFVHELGHFWTARKFGVTVEEFGMGLPPRAAGLQKTPSGWKFFFGKNAPLSGEDSMVYSLNWVPVGGFVKIKGENGDQREDATSFASQAIWKRIIILSAGVAMNTLLCVVFLAVGFGIGMPSMISDNVDSRADVSGRQLRIIEVFDDRPAKTAGVQSGDTIIAVDGRTDININSVQEYIKGKQDQSIALQVDRGGELISMDIPVVAYENTIGVGISMVEVGIVKYPWYLALWQAIVTTGLWVVAIVTSFAMIIYNLIVGAPIGVDVAGPVGIAVLTGQATQLGLIYLLQFTALLSLNLAVINILPFPALDGGRIFFLLIEKLRGRAFKQQWENLAHNLGFALLMLLVVIVTYRDIVRYGGKVWSGLLQMFGL